MDDLFITEWELQYFHAYFNSVLFDNQLSPVYIRIDQPKDEDVEDTVLAAFFEKYDPYLIVIYDDPDDKAYLANKVFILCVLLHEMVHQYCHQNEIQDMDNGHHTELFYDECKKHGMKDGYSFSQSTKEITTDMLMKLGVNKAMRDLYFKM